MSANSPKIRFYVDGLNFYYGVADECKIKWIDMEKLLLDVARQKIPNAEVEKILIFTAGVEDGHPYHSGAKQRQAKAVRDYSSASYRQEVYLNALKAHSHSIEVILGKFISTDKAVWAKPKGGIKYRPIKGKAWEEKQTDVNLACRIVEDAYTEAVKDAPAFDIGCLVSRDGDMSYPLKIKGRLKQKMLLIAPRIKDSKVRPPHDIIKHIRDPKYRILSISREMVDACRLPDIVENSADGCKYTIPPQWQK